MTATRVIQASLIRAIPGLYGFKSRFLFQEEHKYFLRGLMLEKTVQSNAYSVWVFICPTWLLKVGLHLSYGKRIGGGRLFAGSVGDIVSEITEVLAKDPISMSRVAGAEPSFYDFYNQCLSGFAWENSQQPTRVFDYGIGLCFTKEIQKGNTVLRRAISVGLDLDQAEFATEIIHLTETEPNSLESFVFESSELNRSAIFSKNSRIL